MQFHLFLQNLRAVRPSDDAHHRPAIFSGLAIHTHGKMTASAQRRQRGALNVHGKVGRWIVKSRNNAACRAVICSTLNRERSLPCRWTHLLRRKQFLHIRSETQSIQTRGSKNDGIVLTLMQLAQTSVYVATQFANIKIGTQGAQLCLAPQTAGTDNRARTAALRSSQSEQRRTRRVDRRALEWLRW